MTTEERIFKALTPDTLAAVIAELRHAGQNYDAATALRILSINVGNQDADEMVGEAEDKLL